MSKPDWDPGWRALWLAFPFPSVGTRQAWKPGYPDTFTAARFIWLGLAWALCTFWLVLSVIAPWSTPDVGWAPIAIVAAGVLAHVLIGALVLPRMVKIGDGATHGDLLGAFRTGMFLGFGISESVALLGLVLVFMTEDHWLYPLALLFALPGLWRVGPFQRMFVRCDELLAQRGSPLRMTDAWREAVTGTA